MAHPRFGAPDSEEDGVFYREDLSHMLDSNSASSQTMNSRPANPRHDRRLSNSDPPLGVGTLFPAFGRPTTTRSRDGSRWLPNPFQHSRISDRGSGSHEYRQPAETETTPPLELHRCSSGIEKCAALHVFRIPELMDYVFAEMSPRSLYILRRVNRAWNSMILVSPKQCPRLFMLPQWCRSPEDSQVVPFVLNGLSIIVRGDPLFRGQEVIITMTREAAWRILQPCAAARKKFEEDLTDLRTVLHETTFATSFGIVRRQKVPRPFITQPPITRALAWSRPAAQSQDDNNVESSILNLYRPATEIYCDAGLDLGFLAETAFTRFFDDDSLYTLEHEPPVVVFKGMVPLGWAQPVPRGRRNARIISSLV